MRYMSKFLILTACIFLISITVAAAESGDGNHTMRQVYDIIMRWANFLILAYIVVKFSRVPLKNFLRLQRDEIQIGITKLENERALALEKIDEIRAALDSSQAEIEAIQTRIISQGEREKLRRIEEAHEQSEIFLKNTRIKIENMVTIAHDAFKMELLDTALEMTAARLPAIINDDDNNFFFDLYIDSTDSIEKLSV